MSKIPSIQSLKDRVEFREALENGILNMPSCIQNPTEIQLQMWNALWNNYLNNKSSISTPYWFDKFDNPAEFNQFIKALSDDGWINSIVIPGRHWAEIHLIEDKLYDITDEKSINNIRIEKKFHKFKMNKKTVVGNANRTRQNGVTRDTGLVRKGFAKVGTNEFKYDTDYIAKYYDMIVLNVTKGIRRVEQIHTLVEDGADYKSISKEIVDFHLYSADSSFTLGSNLNDSRGRAISSALSKVFNPIGFKDARALLISPDRKVPKNRTIIRQFTQAIYLFIAEFNGVKECSSMQEKAKIGRQMYKQKVTPKVDINDEESLSNLHEVILLERIYDKLDMFFKRDTSKQFIWNIPIELDAQSSMIQISGALLNHSPYLEATNCIGKSITDSWKVDELTRKQVKKAATPYLYGSSQTVQALWTKNNIEFTNRQVALMNYELKTGFYSVVNNFKNLVIDNVNPSEEMLVNINNEEFTIYCNKFRNVGDYTRRYPIFSTAENMVLAIAHTHTHKVADLKQFKRYFQTLLIHNIDSKIADKIALSIEWVLTIHDAFIVNPLDALMCRKLYARELESIHAKRSDIINDYFISINLSRSAKKEWKELLDSIVPVEGRFTCNLMALK